MDLNRLRDQLEQSQPVRVTRTGRLETVDGQERPNADGQGPSQLKRHTFANLGTLARDCAELEANSQARRRLWDGKLAFEETIETNFGVPFTFRMVVPDGFPAVQPRVYCLSPDVPKTAKFHTFTEGSLCLLEPGAWSSDTTLLEVRNWYCEWAFNVVPMLHGADAFASPAHR